MCLWNKNRDVCVAENHQFILSFFPEESYESYSLTRSREGKRDNQTVLLTFQIQNKHCFMIKMNYPDILSHLIRLFFIQNAVGTIT